jgi:GT2 family glycosyltransferase
MIHHMKGTYTQPPLHLTILEDRATGLNEASHTVKGTKGIYPYDYLVIATGSEANDFGIPGVKKHCLMCKTGEDIEAIREKVVGSKEKEAVVMGAGPTGIELACKLWTQGVKVRIVEAADTILPGFSKQMQERVAQHLEDIEVEVLKGKPSLLGGASGAVAGLVAVTPAAGYAGPMGAIVLGALHLRRMSPLGLAVHARIAKRAGLRRLWSLVRARAVETLAELASPPARQDPAAAAPVRIAPPETRPGPPSDEASYAAWIAAFEPEPREDAARARGWLASRGMNARFTIVLAVDAANAGQTERCVGSIVAQAYENWRLIIVDDGVGDPLRARAIREQALRDPRIATLRRPARGGFAAAANDGLAAADGEWTVFLTPDVVLSPDALAIAASTILARPDASVVYSDEDTVDAHGRRSDPDFKTQFDRELLYGRNYLETLAIVRTDLVRRIGGFAAEIAEPGQRYDFILRCLEEIDERGIAHAPFVCAHRDRSQEGEAAQAAERAALERHFARQGVPAQAVEAWPGSPFHRVIRPAFAPRKLPGDDAPLASLIVPTRNRANLLRACIETTSKRAGEVGFEFIVMDNGSDEPETLDLLAEYERGGVARIVRYPGPFNFSAINNAAAQAARGSVLGFLNNDVEALSDDWLVEMLRPLARPDVVAVGAKLLYPDGRVQHAGVGIGMGGVAGHPYRLSPGDDPGPFGRLRLACEVGGATAACLLVRKRAFDAVGGFDSDRLAVAFNDVDLCLKLRHNGGRIVWTPFAAFTHHESVSRGIEDTPEKRARFESEVRTMLDRWGEALPHDPCWSPNLDIENDQGDLAWPPRVRRPWEAGGP